MATLRLTAAGVQYDSPIGAASCGLTEGAKRIIRLYDHGVDFVVMKTCSRTRPTVDLRNRIVHGDDGSTQNCEGISQYDFYKFWVPCIKEVRDKYPDKPLFLSFLEVRNLDEWEETAKRGEELGVSGFELNFGCPQDVSEDGLGKTMGQQPDVVGMVCHRVSSVTKLPVYAKMTPNINSIGEPAKAALDNGCHISGINTLSCIMGIDLDTFIPYPSNGELATPGGYGGTGTFPVALNMLWEVSDLIESDPRYADKKVSSWMGGVNGWREVAEFILMGARTVQICSALYRAPGVEMIKPLKEGLLAWMEDEKRDFSTLDDFRKLSMGYMGTFKQCLARDQAEKAAGRSTKPAGFLRRVPELIRKAVSAEH